MRKSILAIAASCAAFVLPLPGYNINQSPIEREKKKIDDKFGEGTSDKVMNKIKVHSEALNKAEAKRYRKKQKAIRDQSRAAGMVC